MRLLKQAYAMCQQLGDEVNLEEIKHALYTAFGTISFLAWKQSIGWQLNRGETVEIYLTDLRRLLVPFGSMKDHILGCLFLPVLPDDVSWLLWMSSRLDELGIDHLLARAQSIRKDMELVAAAGRTTYIERRAAGNSKVLKPRENLKCNRNGGPNDFSRNCCSQSNTGGMNDQWTKEWLHCYFCNLAIYHEIVQETGSGTRYCCYPCPLSVIEYGITWSWHTSGWHAMFSAYQHWMFPINS